MLPGSSSDFASPTRDLPELVYLVTETGGKVKLDGLGGVLTSHQDLELPISSTTVCPRRVNTLEAPFRPKVSNQN